MGIDYTKRPASKPPATETPAAAPSAAPAAGQPGGVSLSKVRLTKAAPTVSLSKHGGGKGGMLRVNLNWDVKPPERGFFKKNVPLDLDLGCLYEFTDGTKGVVQAMGNAFKARPRGSSTDLIWLDADDRSGANTEGENLFINLDGVAQIKRILVFALIYQGAANWAAAKGVTTILPRDAAPIEILLDEARDGARVCAIAMLTSRNGELTIQREVNYIDGAQRKLDEAYSWGMNWTAGRK